MSTIYNLWKFRLINASIQQHCSCTATDEVWVSCCRTVISESTTAVWKKLRILFRSEKWEICTRQKCTKMHYFHTKKSKKFWSILPRPNSHWGGDTPPQTIPPSAPLDSAPRHGLDAFGVSTPYPAPPYSEILDAPLNSVSIVRPLVQSAKNIGLHCLIAVYSTLRCLPVSRTLGLYETLRVGLVYVFCSISLHFDHSSIEGSVIDSFTALEGVECTVKVCFFTAEP